MIEMASSNSSETSPEGSIEEGRKRKSRIALYTDELRFSIIEEVYKRSFLWHHTEGGEGAPASVRKKAFVEIATALQSQKPDLKGGDVEKQWKNLKDTYAKVRKKLPTNDTTPRWRFYRLLKFIDSDAEFNFAKELAGIRAEQQKSHSLSPTNTSTPSSQLTSPRNNHLSIITTSSSSNPTTLKRENNNELTYVRHTPINGTSSSDSTPKSNGSIDCEYTAFCQSLIHPLREIGTQDRIEFFKFQKTIRDALFDVQMRIHGKTQK